MSIREVPDTDALAVFKACFGIKAKSIESAYQEVSRLTGEVDKQRKVLEASQRAAASAKQKHETASARAKVHTQKPLMDAEADVEEQKKALSRLEAELESAEWSKRSDPWKVYLAHRKWLLGRLANAGKTEKDVPDKLWQDPVDTFDKSDLPKFEQAVLALTAKVDELVGPTELRQKQENIANRIQSLGAQSYKNSKLLGEIGTAATTADMATLSGDLENRLAVAERQSTAFAARFDPAVAKLAAIKSAGALKDEAYANIDKTKSALMKAATALDDGTVAPLDTFEKDLEDLQAQSDEAAKLRDGYGARKAALEAAISGFTARSPSHTGFATAMNKPKLKVSQAEGWFKSRDFDIAMNTLEEGEDLLDGFDARATAQGDEKAKEAAELARLQKKKADAQAAAVAAAAAQKALEDADNVASLNAIGRNGKLKQWLLKIGRLINLNLVTVTAGAARDLNNNGDTIEVRLTIAPTPVAPLDDDSFVVHYHPYVTNKQIQQTGGSQMHSKAYIGAPSFKNLEIEETPWVAQYVDSFAVIRSRFT